MVEIIPGANFGSSSFGGWCLGDAPEWVFTNRDGRPLNEHNLRDRVFYKAVKKAGLRSFRIHDLRHTYASLLFDAGENPKFIQEQLGHRSLKTTLNFYAHLIARDGRRGSVDRLDDPEFGENPGENRNV